MAPVGFQEGPGRAPKVVGAPQLGPREPSGKLIRSIGAFLLEVLDLQKVARACILRRILQVF